MSLMNSIKKERTDKTSLYNATGETSLSRKRIANSRLLSSIIWKTADLAQ